ncbi:hypothetical protein MMC25_005074 [Agyrium rufum]|nr:hypothetical protein [Agyrium rufum]
MTMLVEISSRASRSQRVLLKWLQNLMALAHLCLIPKRLALLPTTGILRRMSSPAKRRKKNDFQPSPQPVRSLDFFFNKPKKTADTPPPIYKTADTVASEPYISHNGVTDAVGESLTDEELARRLQEEWNNEDQQGPPSSAHSVPKEEDKGQNRGENASTSNGIVISEIKSAKPGAKGTLSLQSAVTVEDKVTPTISFDESPLTFDPQKYLSELKAHWAQEGGHATYALLTRCFVLVNNTQSRIKIVDTLVNLLRTIIEGDPESLLPVVWLATNAISPPYISLELGLGGSAISKALKKVCALDNASLKSLYDKYGDAGDVAFEAKKRQSFTLRKPKPLSIPGVYQSLVKIANSRGNGSQEFKQRIVERLLQDAQGAEESRYIVRTLCQHLRIGAVKTTMLIALSRAFLLSSPPGASFPVRQRSELQKLKKDQLAEVYSKGEELVKACFARRPNYNDLVPCLLEVGIDDELLIRCGLALHIPLRPMLGSITRDLSEMLTKLQGREFSCEYKYDGQRAQVHCDANGKVSIFSRHLEVMTDKYPDLVALVPEIRGEGVSSFILEGEVVAVDKETGELKAFQTLTNRARKDVAIGEVKIDVCLFSFDLMYLNGESLLDRPFRERRGLLRSLFVEIPNRFTWVKSLDASSTESETVLEFFKSATDIKCEGIMVKILDNMPNPDLVRIQEAENPSSEAPTSDASPPPAKPAPPTPSKSKKKSAKPPKSSSKTTTTTSNTETPSVEELQPTNTRRKPLLSTYEPDKRLDSWLKVKKDYSTTSDTLDLIPIAAWHGQGRKAAFWSPILLAVRNPATGSLEAVTKCISGFTDAFYKANKTKYSDDVDEDGNPVSNFVRSGGSGGKPGYVDYEGGRPDIWFEPSEVWEMAFADITLSPTYSAARGLVSEERGLSMRFPRFLRVREDKSVEEASTSEFLAGLWFKQEERGARGTVDGKGGKGGLEGDEDGGEDEE